MSKQKRHCAGKGCNHAKNKVHAMTEKAKPGLQVIALGNSIKFSAPGKGVFKKEVMKVKSKYHKQSHVVKEKHHIAHIHQKSAINNGVSTTGQYYTKLDSVSKK